MTGWCKVTLSSEDVTARKDAKLLELFRAIFLAAGAPRNAGMFKSSDVMISEYYFSPGATTIAEELLSAYAGEECSAPALSDARSVLVSGDADSIPFER